MQKIKSLFSTLLKPNGISTLAMEVKDLAKAFGYKRTQNKEINFGLNYFQMLKNHAQKI